MFDRLRVSIEGIVLAAILVICGAAPGRAQDRDLVPAHGLAEEGRDIARAPGPAPDLEILIDISRTVSPGERTIVPNREVDGFDLDGPLPDIPESNASKSGRQRVIDRARRDNLTVRQLARIAGSYGGLSMVGTGGFGSEAMGTVELWVLWLNPSLETA